MRYFTCFVLLVAAAGCSTVQGVFSHAKADYSDINEQAMREAARSIEKAVFAGDRQASFQDIDGIVVSDEAVQQAIRTRISRSSLVMALLDSGHAWERSDGMLSILRTREYKKEGSSRDRDRAALMVASEAENRWTIYEGIRKSSNLPPKSGSDYLRCSKNR